MLKIEGKANRIDLFNFTKPTMRAFHMSWFAFFLCFFAWFGVAPLMPIIRDELGLTKEQIGNTIIASVAITIIARLIVGWMVDKIGPRISYSTLLILCSLPVMGIGFAHDYQSFLIYRLAIGAIGASFVVTQYHTSVMFASNCVGTANATAAGWGNLGGGVTQMVMPLIFAAFVGLGYTAGASWRLSMVVAGILCALTGVAYYFLTTDLPKGNFKDLKKGEDDKIVIKAEGKFFDAAKDIRVWILFFMYAACFGIEITINNIAALYFTDYFSLGLKTAGLVAGTFGLMNIFARSLGGIIGDRIGANGGLKGRVKWLFIAALCEGIALIIFSRMDNLIWAIGSMILFSLFVQMSEGATYSVVPFINRKALGAVTGIVAAGGNIGAVLSGFLFRSPDITWPNALLIIGIIITLFSFSVFIIRFSAEDEELANEEIRVALEQRSKEDKEIKTKVKDKFSLPAYIQMIKPMDVLRLYLGCALMIKGIHFILGIKQIEVISGTIGNFQNVIANYVIFAHLIGGLCLLIGMATRLASAINIPVLIGAIFFVHYSQGLLANEAVQFSALVLVSLILVVWNGAGPLSLDAMLKREKK